MRRWISMVGRPAAAGGFALVRLGGGARQHAVLGGDPASPLAAQEGRTFSTLAVHKTRVSPKLTSTEPPRGACSGAAD